MKYITAFVFLLLSCAPEMSAQLGFRENGSALFTGTNSFVKSSPTPFALDTMALASWNAKRKTAFRKEMIASIEASLDALPDSNTLARWLLDTNMLNTMRTQLTTTRDELQAGGGITVVAPNEMLYKYTKELNTVLAAPLYRLDTIISTRSITYKLTRDEILPKFLTKYYSSLLDTAVNKPVMRPNVTDFHVYYLELKRQYDSISVPLQRIYREARPETIEALYASHLQFRSYLRESKYIKLLRLPFFAQWLWSTGGDIRLNPLDFSASALMDTVSTIDLLSKTFTKAEFVARNKQLQNENAKNLQKLSNPAQVVTTVDFPVADTARNQYFLLDTKEKDLEIKKIRPLDKGEKIYLLLLNLDKGYKARYRITSTKDISGKSPTEEVIDTIASSAFNLYQLLNPQATAISGIIGALNNSRANETVLDNSRIIGSSFAFDVETPSGKELINLTPVVKIKIKDTAQFWQDVKDFTRETAMNILQGQNSDFTFYSWAPISGLPFREDLFDVLKRKYKGAAAIAVKKTAKDMEDLKAKIVSEYIAKMYAQQIAPIAIDSLRNDSLRIAQLINVIAFSSVPVTKLETSTDTIPKYHSALLIIDDKEENKEKTVLVDQVSSKPDSASIVSFNYKKGRHSLFEASFGLSYTTERVLVQKNTAGKISSKDERFRGIAAIHFYPFKTKKAQHLYKIDEPFFGGLNRVNFMLGVGVPKPLDNYYVGIGYDFGPGLKLNSGIHFHKYRQYTVSNDEITSDKARFEALVPYVSLSINPEIVVKKIISIFQF